MDRYHWRQFPHPAGYINLPSQSSATTVASESEVFASAVPAVSMNSGFISTLNGTVVVLASGTYTYDYKVSVDEPGSLELTDDGVVIAGTSFGRSSTRAGTLRAVRALIFEFGQIHTPREPF